MSIDYWFPTAIYNELLQPPSNSRQLMLDYVDKFHGEHPNTYCVTGDVANDSQLAHKAEFSWLNSEVGKHCNLYLEAYGVDTDKVLVYSSKAWPVVCNPKLRMMDQPGTIAPHTHPNAHLSVVYYLQTDSEAGGDLIFEASPTHPLRYLPINPEKQTLASMDCLNIPPIENNLVIFPSSVRHEVILYYGDINRYSITYDIIITAKEDLEGDNEMLTTHSNTWIELHD